MNVINAPLYPLHKLCTTLVGSMNLDTYIHNRIDLIWFICTDWISGSIDFHLFASKREYGEMIIFSLWLSALSLNWCYVFSCLTNTIIDSTLLHLHAFMFIRLLFPCLPPIYKYITLISFMEFLYQRVSIILTLIEYGVNNLLPLLVIMENRFSFGSFFFSFLSVDGEGEGSFINALAIVCVQNEFSCRVWHLTI